MQKLSKFTESAFAYIASRTPLVAAFWLAILATAITASAQDAPPPPSTPEEHWYTNPFYIITGILVLALVPQILYQRRKRKAEREAVGRLRVVPTADVGFGLKQAPKKKSGRLSKEEMSSLLKASASPAPVYETDAAKDMTADASVADAAALANSGDPGAFVAPAATAPIETGTTIMVEELAPASAMSPIADFSDDDEFLDALDQMQDPDGETRAVAVRVLGQFKSRNAVSALTFAVANDPDSTVRAAAVASLGMLGHESVFPAVLTSCADPAPDVRLAAARTLSDLKFSRAEAYSRLIAEGDTETLTKAVAACQQTGMTQRAFDRLASPDSRQSYEAFAILSLLVRAGENKPLFNAIAQHPAENVRLAAVKLLRNSNTPGIFANMAEMADQPALTPRVRAALMDDSKPRKKREPVASSYSFTESAPASRPAEPMASPAVAAQPVPVPPAVTADPGSEFTNNAEEVSPRPPAGEVKPAQAPVFHDDPLDI